MISIIFPAHNEAEKIEEAVLRTAEEAKKLRLDFEIIIAEDGSTDGTDEIASRLAETYDFVKHLHSDERLGRGEALRRALKESRGDVVIYMDADLSTDISHLKDLVDNIKDYDIVIGSRLLRESDAKRPLSREIPSRVYNFLVRFLLKSNIRDHQCGFKALKRNAAEDLFFKVKDNHWFFDTELLILAQRKGYRIKEIPVRWRHEENSKVKLLKDSFYMLKNIIRLMR